MRKTSDGQLLFSPSDLITFLDSPFASWMDRHSIENPGSFKRDALTEDQQLVVRTGLAHEEAILEEFRQTHPGIAEIKTGDFNSARESTLEAIENAAPLIFQAALGDCQFAGYADFLIRLDSGRYQVWDAKLARSPKPYYAVQLSCYSELLALIDGGQLPSRFGIVLGSQDRVEFRVEDFIHYYRRLKSSFLKLQASYSGDLSDRPDPNPSADHHQWSSQAERFLDQKDHLWRVAGISSGQIKKLNRSGITTMNGLAEVDQISVPKLPAGTLNKLVRQAKLQRQTDEDRSADPNAPPRFELLAAAGPNNEPLGLALLPAPDAGDVFFDIEGYPLVAGGLEYLFGVCIRVEKSDQYDYLDWWAHDRTEEKAAFEGFAKWAYKRWLQYPGMHIYHYAAYEISALRRLSTRHDTCQDEIDEMLRNEVFVDLYRVVRQALRIGERDYSIKSVEHLYRPKRAGEVSSAVDSIVQYANWIESKQQKDWRDSSILDGIRKYNIDDCESTAELLDWLMRTAEHHGITPSSTSEAVAAPEQPELSPEVLARIGTISALREKDDEVAHTLADLVDFHRREAKPTWWALFDRAASETEELRDDKSCVANIHAVGKPIQDKRSLVQTYKFDSSQECALASRKGVMFTHNLSARFTLSDIDLRSGELRLKISVRQLDGKSSGEFPAAGSLVPDDYVSPKPIPTALAEVAESFLSDSLPPATQALLQRTPPRSALMQDGESVLDATLRVTSSMNGECLVVQGPPGSGKTYTASHAIGELVTSGASVGIVSNSHKAITNLLAACGTALREAGEDLKGIKVGGESEDTVFSDNPGLTYLSDSGAAHATYAGGVVAGTAWLFARPEWDGALDYLFIDEAGQVSMANAVAISRCAKNLVLLGDQMQLEQPIQGSHPGDAGLSVLQYALKDVEASKPDAPVFHAVVPSEFGLFIGESRRMHPSVCSFVSESFYEGRLISHDGCRVQKISKSPDAHVVEIENGIVFSPVIHDGDVQQSDDEATRVKAIYEDLVGREYTSNDGQVRPLALEDFLFISPYNAQVRTLEAILPSGARIGSVDRFQGQEAPVCVLSLCSSYGEYGSRGLGFILDRNRINVAISRAQCLAVVVADPRIGASTPNSIEEMKLLNLFCKLPQNRQRFGL